MKPLAMHRVVSFLRAGDKFISIICIVWGKARCRLSVTSGATVYIILFSYSTINHSSDE